MNEAEKVKEIINAFFDKRELDLEDRYFITKSLSEEYWDDIKAEQDDEEEEEEEQPTEDDPVDEDTEELEEEGFEIEPESKLDPEQDIEVLDDEGFEELPEEITDIEEMAVKKKPELQPRLPKGHKAGINKAIKRNSVLKKPKVKLKK